MAEFQVTIDRQVDAPGHGKDVVDGLNAQDKVFLRKHMITSCAASEPSKDPNAKVKMNAAVVDGENKAISFAKQCVNICSQEARKMGVISHKKLNKREDKKKMKKDFIIIKILRKYSLRTPSIAKKALRKEITIKSWLTITFTLTLT